MRFKFSLGPPRPGTHHAREYAGSTQQTTCPPASPLVNWVKANAQRRPTRLEDGAGDYYGVDTVGGANQKGTVFELSRTPTGYVHTVVYNFLPYTVGGIDYPISPNGSLVADASGALYGTTAGGGIGPGPGLGTIFKLTPSPSGYTQSTLYAFGTNAADGVVPRSGLIIDKAGTLYGTALDGGAHGEGTVFSLTPTPSGYRERTLHAFAAFPSDGAFPFAGVIRDGSGTLFGTTLTGGSNNNGTVFALTPNRSGYYETVLHRFTGGYDGNNPYGGLVADRAENLYGTTEVDGVGGGGSGTAFELVAAAGYRETLLHAFGKKSANDGADPFYALIIDAAGNLWGTTPAGGATGNGTAFELGPVP
jgi:uncharacterized repeat protein (TIGR03803 family)